MAKIENLNDVLLDELKDIYSAENQLLKALPGMAKKASSPKLREAFQSHLEETEGQVKRLEKIAAIVGEKLSGKTCKAMKGLIEEGKEVLEEESDTPALIDTMLTGAARRVEHYEIAAYETACAIAQELGLDDVVELLDANYDEEVAADEKLSGLAERELLVEANGSKSDEEDDESGVGAER